jgi:cell division protein FtsQ
MTAVRRRAFPRVSPAVAIGLIVLAALLGGGWLWLRDSSLVAVQRVTVTGASGPDAAKVRTALVAAARNMTTLDVSMGQLDTAIAPYPDVKRLNVSTSFPHGMRIQVVEQIPVAVVSVGGREIEVAGDGTLLHAVGSSASLPTIPLGVAPGGTHLTGWARGAVALLAAAPYQLLAHISEVVNDPDHGLTAELRKGPNVYFGSSRQLAAKWSAAAAVLADKSSVGAEYIDVSDPSRPAAGVTGAQGTASAPTASAVSATSGTTPGTASETATPSTGGTTSTTPATTSDGG